MDNQDIDPKNNISYPSDWKQKASFWRWVSIFLFVTLIILSVFFVLTNVDNKEKSENQESVEFRVSASDFVEKVTNDLFPVSEKYIFRLIREDDSEQDLSRDDILAFNTEDVTRPEVFFKASLSKDIYYLAFSHPCDYPSDPQEPSNLLKLKKLQGVEADNFWIYEGVNTYATDGESVYAHSSIGAYCDVISEVFILPGIDPITFKPMNAWYAKDSNQVVKIGAPKLDVDVDTFRFYDKNMRMTGVTLDKDNVYLYDQVISSADPKTYRVIRDFAAAGPGTVYARDDQHVFIDYCLLEGVNPDEFFSENMYSSLIPLRVAYPDKTNAIHEFDNFAVNLELDRYSYVQSCSLVSE